MTEVERYETKGKINKNIKVSPQQQWMDLLSSSLDSCPAHLKPHLQIMASLDNVPRKEKQFRNFASNSLHLHARESERLLSEIWKFLMDLKEQQRSNQQATQAKDPSTARDAADTSNVPETPLNDQTQGLADGVATEVPSVGVTGVDGPDSLTTAVVKKAMKRVLKDSKDNSLPLKKLRRTLRQQLGVSSDGKSKLKRLIKANLSKKYVLDGKVIRLQVH